MLMSTMGDSMVNETKETAKLIKEIISWLIKILLNIEQHHHERVIHGKSLSHKVGAFGAGLVTAAGKGAMNKAEKLAQRLLLSGQIDLKKFDKLQKKTNFVDFKVPTYKASAILESAKKSGIPVFSASVGNNISVMACPAENKATMEKILQMMISKDAERGKKFEFNENKDFKDIDNITLHNIIDSYDIPTVTFQKPDGTEIIAVPSEYQEQYLDVLEEAKETIRNVDNIEISDIKDYVWDDPSTSAIEIFPEQALMLEENYKHINIVNVDGKLYAYGKDIEADVTSVKNIDSAIEEKSNEWSIGVVDNTITLNEKLLGKEEGNKQLVKVPGEKETYILFDKSELSNENNGNTFKSKLDFDRDYIICDASGEEKGVMKGRELAPNFSTRSPLENSFNEFTDKSQYNNSINRIELFNEKTNKLISIPIGDVDSMINSIKNKTGLDDATAKRMINRISTGLSQDYQKKYRFPEKKVLDYSASRSTINKVKSAILGHLLKNFKGQNSAVEGEAFAIIDKRSKEYVFIEKDKLHLLNDKLKEMGYSSIERMAVISKLQQQYNIKGELDHSINYGQTISSTNPALQNVGFSDLGNGFTTIFNLVADKNIMNYVTIDKNVSPLELEEMCRNNLGITDDRAIADMAIAFKDKIRQPDTLCSDKVDGIKYSVSQLTSKFVMISSNEKDIILNKNTLNYEKLAKQLGISEKSANKISQKISASFKANESGVKGVTSLNKLKSVAEKIFAQNKEKSIDEKGQEKTERLHTSERSK